jgi:murein DD-endopeptidase MepM/ murein hydrolase activator NlpD
VRAADDGVIERLVPTPGTMGFRGYGRAIVIKHESLRGPIWTLYAHLNTIEPWLRVGDRAARGVQIGTVGRSCDTPTDVNNLCKAAHLHFEASRFAYPQPSERARLDPTFFLRRE